jgi:hypothetical protein
MAVPSALVARENQLDRLTRTAARLKATCTEFNARAAAGPVTSDSLRELLGVLRDAAQFLLSLPGTPGFRNYVQATLADQGYEGDIVADVLAMRSAVLAAGGRIAAVGPNLYAGYTIDQTNWAETVPTFGPAQTAALRADLAAVAAAIA